MSINYLDNLNYLKSLDTNGDISVCVNSNKLKLCDDIDCKSCYLRSFASVILFHPTLSWNHIRNEFISPRDTFKFSRKKFWITCDTCGHTFETRLAQISGGNKCQYCHHLKLCEDETCDFCFENSFASHSRSENWDYDKNIVNPREVFKGSSKKCHFICDICNHSFPKSLSSVNQGIWCPYCSHKILCDNEGCNSCFENSFANHPRSVNWDYDKNGITPRNVFKATHDKYHMKCGECEHSHFVSPHKVNSGYTCIYCTHQKLCQESDCLFCFENSFASHPRSVNWDYNKNKVTPRNVFKNSGLFFHFICEQDHEFEIKILTISYGSWCTKCHRTRGEQLLSDVLINRNIQVEEQKTFKDLVYTRKLKYDAYFIHNNQGHIIEYDGEQHFDKNNYYNTKRISFEELQEKDLMKTQYCVDNNIRLLRISYLHCVNIELLVDIFLSSEFKCIFSDYDLYEEQITACGGIAASY
jgi:DNA-directed RNA polymerase subunit RPC12/RpoP